MTTARAGALSRGDLGDTTAVRLPVVLLAALGCNLDVAVQPVAPEGPAAPAEVRPRAAMVEAQPSTLRIASWNVRRLGHGDKNLDAVMDVISQFDLVAVQEVMTREVVESLTQRMPSHQALLTDTPTPSRGTYREYFAFFYDPSVLDPVFNAYAPDPDDAFVRDPYLACFTVLQTSDRLCLMTVHVVWGDLVGPRKREILALDEALRWAQEGDDTNNWIVLGDFNRPVDDGDADAEPEEEWRELLDRRRLRAPVVLAGSEAPTTLGDNKYKNAYDHVCVSERLVDRLVEAGRFDIVAEVCEGSFQLCDDRVSDHAPVYVELAVEPR